MVENVDSIIAGYEKSRQVSTYDFLGDDIRDVNTGHPRVPMHEKTLIHSLIKLLEIDEATYLPKDGRDAPVRQVIADYFNFVYKTPGPEMLEGEKLNHFFDNKDCLLDTGSTALFIRLFKKVIQKNPKKNLFVSFGPMYSAQVTAIKELGGEVLCIIGDKENNYQPTEQQINQALEGREDVGLIMRGTQNPYAKVLPKELIQGQARAINKHISKDTIYYDDQPYEGISALVEEHILKYLRDDAKIVVSSSLSKSAGMPGEGGILATNDPALREELKNDIPLSTAATSNEFIDYFFKLIVRQDRELQYALQGMGVNDFPDVAKQLNDIGTKVAEPYAFRQKLLQNLLAETLESYGLDSKAMVGTEDASMYVKFFAGKNEKEKQNVERKNIPDLKSLELSDEKNLYGGKLSFQDILGKTHIETDVDFKKFLYHLKGLDGCKGFDSRPLGIFAIPASDAGVRLCHTNLDEINIDAVKSIYKGLPSAFKGIGAPNKTYEQITQNSTEQAKNYVDKAFPHSKDEKILPVLEKIDQGIFKDMVNKLKEYFKKKPENTLLGVFEAALVQKAGKGIS